MSVIINPGSRIREGSAGWTNTRVQSLRNAYEWHHKMRDESFGHDIDMVDTGEHEDGRWRYVFRHKVTGVEVSLQIHGIDDMDAYLEQALFVPHVYWNGSSSSNPSIEDFAAPGFVATYRQVTE